MAFINSSSSLQPPANCASVFPPAPGQQFWGVSAGPVFWGKSLGGLTFDGSGLLGTGIFGTGVTLTDPTTWSWAEWLVVGLGAFLIFGGISGGKGLSLGGGNTTRSARRKKLAAARAQYELEKAEL